MFTTAAQRAVPASIVAPYVHPSMAYKLLPRFQGQFARRAAVRRADPSAGAGPRPRHPREAEDPVDAPVRHRGRGQPQLLRRRRDGAQQPRDHDRRKGAEVLRLGAPGHPPNRDAEGRPRCGRKPDPRQGREEQVCRAIPPSRIRHPLQSRHQPRGRPDRHGRGARASSASPALGTPTRATSSGRARRTPASSCCDNPDLADEIEKKIKEKLGIGPRLDAEARRRAGAGTGRLLADGTPSGRDVGRQTPVERRRDGDDRRRARGRRRRPPADPESVARSICLSQLTRGPRTRSQLADTLRRAARAGRRRRGGARPAHRGRAGRRRGVRRWVGPVAAIQPRAVRQRDRPRAARPRRRAASWSQTRWPTSDPEEDEASARELARRRAALDGRAAGRRPRCVGWSATSAARATRPGLPTGSSARSSTSPQRRARRLADRVADAHAGARRRMTGPSLDPSTAGPSLPPLEGPPRERRRHTHAARPNDMFLRPPAGLTLAPTGHQQRDHDPGCTHPSRHAVC